MKSIEELTNPFNKLSVSQLFGIMLYTDEHPHIKKVLRDDDYWTSFNQLTGKRFNVFSVKPKVGKYELPTSSNGMMSLMIPIWKEPSQNLKILDAFEIKDTSNLPTLLLFTKYESEYLKIELKLDDTSLESAYTSIKDNLTFATSAINKIKEENLNNPLGLYAALTLHTDKKRFWQKVRNSVNLIENIKNLFS